jgi:hypothetical protein
MGTNSPLNAVGDSVFDANAEVLRERRRQVGDLSARERGSRESREAVDAGELGATKIDVLQRRVMQAQLSSQATSRTP